MLAASPHLLASGRGEASLPGFIQAADHRLTGSSTSSTVLLASEGREKIVRVRYGIVQSRTRAARRQGWSVPYRLGWSSSGSTGRGPYSYGTVRVC